MPMMNSRRKNPPRSKKYVEGRAGRQRAKRAQVSRKAATENSEPRLSSRAHRNEDTQQSPRRSDLSRTPLRTKTGRARSTSPVMVNENSVGRSLEKTSESEHTVLSYHQQSSPESSKAATAHQVFDPPQATPHSSALQANEQARKQRQHKGTKADRDEEKWKAKKAVATASLERATKATEKAKARLDKVVEETKVKVENKIKSYEAKATHKRAVVRSTEARDNQVLQAANAEVEQALRASDAKVERASEAIKMAEARQDRAHNVLQEVKAKGQTVTAESGDAQTVDDGSNSNSNVDPDSSEAKRPQSARSQPIRR